MIKQIFINSLLLYSSCIISSEKPRPYSPPMRPHSPSKTQLTFARKIQTSGANQQQLAKPNTNLERLEFKYVEDLRVQQCSCAECCIKSTTLCCLIVGLPWYLTADQLSPKSTGMIPAKQRSMDK